MFIYQPYISSADRVVWYGGDSTQLHYQQQGGMDKYRWVDRNIQTFVNGMPSDMGELHAVMQEFYNHCQVCEMEERMAMAD